MIRLASRECRFFARSPALLAEGEGVQFRVPHRELGIANGQFATISELYPTNGDVTLRLRR